MTQQKPTPAPADAPEQGALTICHWTITNGSGMHRVAESMVKSEQAIGLNSLLADPSKAETWAQSYDADVHVLHTHIPTQIKQRATKPFRLVWVGHGTPEHVVEGSVTDAEGGAYGHGDGVMLLMHWLKEADARVTFWDRHKWIYDKFLHNGARKCDLVPLGVDRSFWSDPTPSRGKYAGDPSVFTAENPHRIKWPLDLYFLWPDVTEEYPDARLHSIYMPRDMHRAMFPIVDANGTGFTSYISPQTFDNEGLRNAFKSCDFTMGLVRYGDLNHLSLQANAAGARTISYAGNPYATYWVTEGDQREMSKQIKAILGGEVEPRTPLSVPDVSATAEAMARIYRDIL